MKNKKTQLNFLTALIQPIALIQLIHHKIVQIQQTKINLTIEMSQLIIITKQIIEMRRLIQQMGQILEMRQLILQMEQIHNRMIPTLLILYSLLITK
jgi:hypothetical protein